MINTVEDLEKLRESNISSEDAEKRLPEVLRLACQELCNSAEEQVRAMELLHKVSVGTSQLMLAVLSGSIVAQYKHLISQLRAANATLTEAIALKEALESGDASAVQQVLQNLAASEEDEGCEEVDAQPSQQ